MMFHTDHPLQAFWNIAAAPIQGQALELALETGLFEVLDPPATADELAVRLNMHPANTAVWLDLLWSMGLLECACQWAAPASAHYAASPLAVRYFNRASPDNCAQGWQYRAKSLAGVAVQLHELVRKGAAQSPAFEGAATSGAWAQAAREQIGQEQHCITAPAVLPCIDRLRELPSQGSFLDLGGGPGHVAIAIARKLPLWRGTVCDLAETVQVARQNIAQAELQKRLDVLAADLNSNDVIGESYDLIWCSSVLHFMNDPQLTLRRMYEALAPGGRLLIAHAEIRDDVPVAAQVMPFYTPMRLRGKHVFRQGDMPRELASAGFMEIEALGSVGFPMAPVWVYEGRRP